MPPAGTLVKNPSAALAAALALVALCGCAQRKSRAFPWATAILVRPAPPGPAVSPGDGEAPDLRMAVPPVSAHIIPTRAVPPRPRVPAPAGDAVNLKSDAPLIAPEASPGEVSAARAEISESLAIADRNLVTARGRKLSAVQLDLVSKVNGFMNGAREAERSADWSRARNLASKAKVLSEQLVASL